MGLSRAKRQNRGMGGHSSQLHGSFIGSETACKTLDPCSSTHVTAHHPACCNFDGKNPIILIGCEGIEVMSAFDVLGCSSSAKKVETL